MTVALLAVVRLPAMRPEGTDTAGGGPRTERGGLLTALRRPTLWGSMATDLSATLLAMPIALFPLVNENRFGGDPRTLGLFLSAVAVGGITAACSPARRRVGAAPVSYSCTRPGSGAWRWPVSAWRGPCGWRSAVWLWRAPPTPFPSSRAVR